MKVGTYVLPRMTGRKDTRAGCLVENEELMEKKISGLHVTKTGREKE